MGARFVGLAVALALTAACGDDTNGGDGGLDALPAITLPALAEGEAPLDLSDLNGPAVVNLWATWCEPCRRELPAFQQASVDHPGVRFVGVDIGEDAADALAFLDELGVDADVFGQYADTESELTDALGVSALPLTLLIDDDGAIAELHLGPLSTEDLDAAIAELGTDGA